MPSGPTGRCAHRGCTILPPPESACPAVLPRLPRRPDLHRRTPRQGSSARGCARPRSGSRPWSSTRRWAPGTSVTARRASLHPRRSRCCGRSPPHRGLARAHEQHVGARCDRHVARIRNDREQFDLEPGGSLTRFRFSRIASAFFPVCGTGGMFRSVPETFICLSFSMFCCACTGARLPTASATANAIPFRVPAMFVSCLIRLCCALRTGACER